MNRRAVFSLAGVAAVGAISPTHLTLAADATKANIALAKTFVADVLNGGNSGTIDTIVDPNIAASNPNDAPGADAFKARIASWVQTIGYSVKGGKFTTKSVVASGNDVIVRGYITGSSSQGKAISATYFVQLTVKSGLIVGSWHAHDFNALIGA